MRLTCIAVLLLSLLVALIQVTLGASPKEGTPCDPEFARMMYNVPEKRGSYFKCEKIDKHIGEYKIVSCGSEKMFNFTEQRCDAASLA